MEMELAVKRGQWENVSFDKWIDVERFGTAVRFGECEMTEVSSIAWF